ncbi:MAG: thiol-disulfide isomerase/thioredoxin [Crocinitomix sp.]|jgi:thiol-disulfide isomerase/thioredoxin
MKIIFLVSFLTLSLCGFSRNKKVQPGYWHSEFKINATTMLPVTFLLEKGKKTVRLFVINADESIELTDIVQKKDSLFISFPAFDSQLKAKILKKNCIVGSWFNYAKGDNYAIPFTCVNEYLPRFPKMGSTVDIFGKWEVTFDYDKEPEKAIGVFDPITTHCSYSQKDVVKGTFLTETGDYRYLEGVVSNDSLYLSTFDGSHAFLFRSKLKQDTLWGEFLSGTHYKSNWYAVRNASFELTDPDSLTYLVTDDNIHLSLPDLNNNTYVYPNEDTKGKATLIQIMGTWCPNCLDESKYLVEQKKKFGDQLEIIAVTFETQKTTEERIAKVKKYKENLNLNYTFLIGGKASKTSASELFPMLNRVISFPTLIFIDKEGEVKRIHTGFNGPGTGMYYDEFVEKTDSLIEQLIKE